MGVLSSIQYTASSTEERERERDTRRTTRCSVSLGSGRHPPPSHDVLSPKLHHPPLPALPSRPSTPDLPLLCRLLPPEAAMRLLHHPPHRPLLSNLPLGSHSVLHHTAILARGTLVLVNIPSK